MAKAKPTKSGLGVALKLTFREAAALKALLARVDTDTNHGVAIELDSVYWALSGVHSDVLREDTRLWPRDFEVFESRNVGLVEPEPEEDES